MKASSKYWGGWHEYRYGRESAVHVPGKSAVVPNKQARERMISEVRELLLTFTSTPFEYEGTCRHGIRAGLCIEGAGWQMADDVAAYVVGEGLRSIGARRPTWEQGQREYVIPEECCAWCGREIDQVGLRQDRFCSGECAKAHWHCRDDQEGTKLSIMHRRARRIIVREQQPERRCKRCGTVFRPSDPSRPTGFCSLICAKTLIPDRECEHCGKTFHPVNRSVRFCSRTCEATHRREPGKQMECITCGTVFTASRGKRVAYCSDSCRSMHGHLKSGRYLPKRISAIVFDFYIAAAVNARPPWLTVERSDEMAARAA